VRLLSTLLAAATATLGFAADANAQGNYPSRPITMIVPFAAGGPTDVIARIVSDHMSRTLGQQIVVENVAGASQAQGDGYTVMMGHMGTHGAAPALYPNLKYDPTKDFAPIGLAAGKSFLATMTIGVPAASPIGAKSLVGSYLRLG
jgi:tripartite-type tricarboxylate transporter receptor subunit TctC